MKSTLMKMAYTVGLLSVMLGGLLNAMQQGPIAKSFWKPCGNDAYLINDQGQPPIPFRRGQIRLLPAAPGLFYWHSDFLRANGDKKYWKVMRPSSQGPTYEFSRGKKCYCQRNEQYIGQAGRDGWGEPYTPSAPPFSPSTDAASTATTATTATTGGGMPTTLGKRGRHAQEFSYLADMRVRGSDGEGASTVADEKPETFSFKVLSWNIRGAGQDRLHDADLMRNILPSIQQATPDITCLVELPCFAQDGGDALADFYSQVLAQTGQFSSLMRVQHPGSPHSIGISYNENKFICTHREVLQLDAIKDCNGKTRWAAVALFTPKDSSMTNNLIIGVIACHLFGGYVRNWNFRTRCWENSLGTVGGVKATNDHEFRRAQLQEIVNQATHLPATQEVTHWILCGDFNWELDTADLYRENMTRLTQVTGLQWCDVDRKHSLGTPTPTGDVLAIKHPAIPNLATDMRRKRIDYMLYTQGFFKVDYQVMPNPHEQLCGKMGAAEPDGSDPYSDHNALVTEFHILSLPAHCCVLPAAKRLVTPAAVASTKKDNLFD